MEDTGKLFLLGLPPKVDALELALESLDSNEEEAISSIKYLIRFLHETSETYGFSLISEMAVTVEDSTRDSLESNIRELINVLRKEIGRVRQVSEHIALIIGGNPDSNNRIIRLLHEDSYKVFHKEDLGDVHESVRANDVTLIILNCYHSDLEGLQSLSQLREDSVTASVRIIILDSAEQKALYNEEDFIVGTEDINEIVEQIKIRLRVHEGVEVKALRDIQTGLLNRAAFHETCLSNLHDMGKVQESMVIAYFSIDDFSAIIDSYGIAGSVELIQHVSLDMSNSMRATDVLARWGISEFAALFPGEDISGGVSAAEKLVKKFRNMKYDVLENETVKITLSAGVVLVREGSSVDDAMIEAERYLLDAQSHGGDNVIYSKSEIPAQTRRVLLVHDDNTTGSVIKQILERVGIDVEYIHEQSEIVDSIIKRRYRLVIISPELKDCDGFQILKDLRDIPNFDRMSILVLLADGSEESKVRALELGASSCLAKPYSPSTLMAQIRRLLIRSTRIGTTTGRMRRILIISDDTKDLIAAASSISGHGGFRVYLAKGWENGYKRCEDLRPDVVFIDLDTFNIDENMVCQRAKDCSIVLAAKPSVENDQLLERGVKGIIEKPLRYPVLGKEISRILHIPDDVKLPVDRTEHLNHEIQHILIESAKNSSH